MEKNQLIPKVREAADDLRRMLASRGSSKAADSKKLRECLADLEAILGVLDSRGKRVDAGELIVRVYTVLDHLVSWLNK